MRFGAFRTTCRTAQTCFGLQYKSALSTYRPLACMVPFTRVSMNPATGSILSASLSCRNFAISLGDSDLAELLTMAEADEVASTVVSSGVSQNNIFIGMGTALDHLYSQETSY